MKDQNYFHLLPKRVLHSFVWAILFACSTLYGQQETVTFDATYFSSYSKEFIPYSKESAPAYVFEPRSHAHSFVYPQLHYCVLDSIELYGQSLGIVYALSDSPVNPTDPYFVYYLAVFKMENGTLSSTAENFKLVEQNTAHYTTVLEFTKSELINGSYLNTYNANEFATTQPLFPLVVTPIVFPPAIPPPMDIYPPCIIPPYWGGWVINPILYTPICNITVWEEPKKKPVPPFDVKKYLENESKHHFYRTALQLPYGTYSTRQSGVEHGLYRLSDVILSAKLKTMTQMIKENTVS